jgi:uncharacterized BrkB/YihY/UPF0761 family membrane protein
MSEENGIPRIGSNESATPVNPNKGKSGILRTWLMLLTIVSSLVCLLTAACTVFASFALLFSFDNPDTTWSDFLTMQGGLFGIVATLTVLTLVGIGGGWVAYHKGRTNYSLVTSLLALIPICLCLAGIAIFFATSSPVFPIDITINP